MAFHPYVRTVMFSGGNTNKHGTKSAEVFVYVAAAMSLLSFCLNSTFPLLLWHQRYIA